VVIALSTGRVNRAKVSRALRMPTSPDDLGLEVFDFAQGAPALAFAFVLGALLGSFANVCIVRLPAGMSIVRPPSHCFSCQAPVAWYDNIPIVSYFVLRGRCRRCGAGYAPRYMLVEAATGLLFAATWYLCLFALHPEDPFPTRAARFAIYALFELALVVITFIDLDHKLILDVITYPAIPLFYGLGWLLADRPWWDPAIGVVVGYGLVRLISDGYWLLTKREGMGYGDGKLLAMIGALLGWQAVIFSLFGGAMLGSVLGIGILLWQRRRAPVASAVSSDGAADEPEIPMRHVEIPFGPYIVGAALVYLFLQQQISVQVDLFLHP
jgi:leader peptidase (prepilin peptidase)/N-methyltransferase